MRARERLHGKMDSLVPLQIVISVEALWALVALEWPVVRGCLLWWMTKEGTHACSMTAVEPVHHTMGHAANEIKLTVGIRDVLIYGRWWESHVSINPWRITMR